MTRIIDRNNGLKGQNKNLSLSLYPYVITKISEGQQWF